MQRIPERIWRKASRDHAFRIHEILRPGLTRPDHPLNTGLRRQRKLQERKQQIRSSINDDVHGKHSHELHDESGITALDPKNPVFNFLIEYYGLKGTKGVRRLMKWPVGIDSVDCGNDMTENGVVLEGAIEQDFASTLHPKGAHLSNGGIFRDDFNRCSHNVQEGVTYSPFHFVYGSRRDRKGNQLAAFQWYRRLLEKTIDATPVLHCYGLHEWAMQYQPTIDRDPSFLPPSSKYQSHLRMRVDQETLNETVESNTIYCTHVDAWKFFAEDALPFNQFYKSEPPNNPPPSHERAKVLLSSEQPACVHTTMDLLKIALKLGPFCDAQLFCRVLSSTIEARILDVSASPYDAKKKYGVEPIPIETSRGRNEYKLRQYELMKRTEPIRVELLENYKAFLSTLNADNELNFTPTKL